LFIAMFSEVAMKSSCRSVFALAVLIWFAHNIGAQRLSESTGVNLFTNNCVSCHGPKPAEHAPTEAMIRQMSPERIYEAITTGPMKNMAANLADADKVLLAEFMGGRKLDSSNVGDAKSMPNVCTNHPPVRDLTAPAWNGWGDNSNTRAQSAKGGGLSAGQVSRLKLKWAFGFPGATALYGQTVVDGRVFVSSNAGYVYSLDAQTGCIHWSLKTQAAVRSGIIIGPQKPGSNRMVAYFGDIRGNAYGVDASNGELLWQVLLDSHPLARVTAAPKLYEGRVYMALASLEEDESRSANYVCCTFRGVMAALDSETGRQIWKSYTIPEKPKVLKKNSLGVDYMGPSGAGVWTSPIIDPARRAIYFGTGNAFSEPATTADSIMAMSMDTGEILWHVVGLENDIWHNGCQQTVPGRTPPPAAGGRRAGGAPGGAPPPGGGRGPAYPADNCVDKTGPDWDYSASPSLATLPDGRTIIIAPQKQGMVRAHDPDKKGAVIWEQDVARMITGGGGETVFGGAVDKQNAYFGLHSGGLVAVDLLTGTEKWWVPLNAPEAMAQHRGIVAAVSIIPGVLFSGGVDGMLRANSLGNGQTIWEFNTARDFDTVNGVKAKGGSIGAGGPTIANGMVFVGSGYVGFTNGVPGNVLLAFAP
jgi:polyvinyl alcohol dehydrogenase (cytochrome)